VKYQETNHYVYLMAINGYHLEVVTGTVTVFRILHERNDNSKGTAQNEFLFLRRQKINALCAELTPVTQVYRSLSLYCIYVTINHIFPVRCHNQSFVSTDKYTQYVNLA